MNPPWIPRIWSLDSPLGPLLVATSDTGLCRLHFSRDASSRSQMAHELMEAGLELSSLANVSDRRVDRQLRDYFQQRRKTFDLPLDLRLATPFGRDHVLPSLCRVPFGVTVSYAELARRAGRPGGARAVGQAVRRNPLPIVIPCHRVISSNGSLGGFSPNLALKRRLLAHEGVTPKSQRLP